MLSDHLYLELVSPFPVVALNQLKLFYNTKFLHRAFILVIMVMQAQGIDKNKGNPG